MDKLNFIKSNPLVEKLNQNKWLNKLSFLYLYLH